MNIFWRCTHPQATQDVDEFVFFIGTDLEKFSITSVLTNGLSFWRHPFTAEDSLVSKCDVMLNLSKSVLMKNLTYIWGWIHFQKSFEFWVNYSFNYDLPISYGSVNIWISTCISQIYFFLETMCSHLKTHVFCKRDGFRLPSLIWQHIPLKSRPWWMVLNMTFAYRWPTANSVARFPSGQNHKKCWGSTHNS